MVTAREHDFSNLGFRDTTVFYSDIRKALYEKMNSLFPSTRCSPISYGDAVNADKWRHVAPDKGRDSWSWVSAYTYYQAKNRFKRFDLCVRHGSIMTGLAYGMPTKAKTKLKIDIIEATPYEKHKRDTKIFDVISVAAQSYALLLGANEVRIMNPLNEKLSDYYCSFGYELIQPAKKNIGVYCSLKVGS